MEEYGLKVANMSKSLLGVKALDNVKLIVKPGSVHALIDENEAGKSTLMKCLFGLYHPDSGTIEIDGRVMDIEDPNDALKNGIFTIHQELDPVPYRNVVDSIWAGRSQTKGVVVDENQVMEKTRNLPRDLDFDIDVTTFAKNFPVSQMQAIEITKAVSYNAKIIIMDEPISSLTVAETQHLFRIVDKLREEGRSIIYISHKLEKIFEIADEITVMRDGQYIGTWDIKDIIVDRLIGQMVGRKMNERFPLHEDARTDEMMLQVKNSTSADPRSFKNVSLDPHRGEILDIGELVGAQRTGPIEATFGLRRIVSEELIANGETMVNYPPQDVIRNGLTLLTEECRATGIIPMLSVWDNTLTVVYKKLIGNVFGYIHTKKLLPSVDKVCTDLDVHVAGTKTLIKNLSGGNRQKALIDRWLLASRDVTMLDEPTKGMDVGAKHEIYRIMQDLVKKGKAIIMASSKMPELLGMSDHIMTICAGKQTGILGKTEIIQVEMMKYTTQFEDKTKEGVSV